jgi:hypothetical protein
MPGVPADVANQQHHHPAASGLHQCDTVGDVQRLADGVAVPGGPSAWCEPDQPRSQTGRRHAFDDHAYPHGAVNRCEGALAVGGAAMTCMMAAYVVSGWSSRIALSWVSAAMPLGQPA